MVFFKYYVLIDTLQKYAVSSAVLLFAACDTVCFDIGIALHFVLCSSSIFISRDESRRLSTSDIAGILNFFTKHSIFIVLITYSPTDQQLFFPVVIDHFGIPSSRSASSRPREEQHVLLTHLTS